MLFREELFGISLITCTNLKFSLQGEVIHNRFDVILHMNPRRSSFFISFISIFVNYQVITYTHELGSKQLGSRINNMGRDEYKKYIQILKIVC